MRALAGLGNPGEGYRRHRHNAGWMLLDAVSARSRVLERRRLDWVELLRVGVGQRQPGRGRGGPDGGDDAGALWLLRPLTYMNRSGLGVTEGCDALGLEPGELVVAYDDIDLPLGRLRLRPAGGAGGHRGMESVLEALDTQEVPRLRMGIRGQGVGRDTAEYVLSPFTAEELPAAERMIARAADAVETILMQGFTAAMDAYNPQPGD